MELIDDLRSVRLEWPTILTIGNFDGLHLGHQALVRKLQELAADPSYALSTGGAPKSAMLTFDPHPIAVLRPGIPHDLLTTPQERLELAARLGVDIGIRQPFTHELAELEPQAFMQLLTRHLKMVALVVGPDFALGKNRGGDLTVLHRLGEQLGFDLVIQGPIKWQGISVHSSTIRRALAEGNVEEAAGLLGRPYHVTGTVVEGDRRGRQIGFPTANLNPPVAKLLPANGVYITHAKFDWGGHLQEYHSVTNIGVRPTVDGLHHRVETHLLAFNPAELLALAPPMTASSDPLDCLYGASLTIEFLARIRAEQRFASLDALVAQIGLDAEEARRFFEQRTR